MSAPVWEQSKENVAPLARGRDKAALHVALQATRAEVQEAHAAHEAAVAAAARGKGPHASDPLAPAAAFVKWAAEAYPPRAPPLLRALESSCESFVGNTRYANDPRYVRLWVRYADLRDDPLECFLYMRRHGIGKAIALFYEAWATTLEYKHDFPGADSVYKLGLERDAQPKARLEQRYNEFQARMMKRAQRDKARAAKAMSRSDADGRADPSSRRNKASDLAAGRTTSRSSRRNDENARPALGPLTARQAASSHRPLAPLESAPNSQGEVRVPREKRTLSSTSGAPPSHGNSDSAFRVFRDPHPLPSVDGDSLPDASGFPSMAKLDSVQKENEGELPSKWSGVVLPQSSPLSRARQRSRRNITADFEVFSDPAEDGGEPQTQPQGSDPDKRRSRSSDVASRRSQWTASGPPSPTINTKIAMQQVEDMFNTTLPLQTDEDAPSPFTKTPSEVQNGTPKVHTISKPDFEVYCDAPSASKTRPKRALSPSARTESNESGRGQSVSANPVPPDPPLLEEPDESSTLHASDDVEPQSAEARFAPEHASQARTRLGTPAQKASEGSSQTTAEVSLKLEQGAAPSTTGLHPAEQPPSPSAAVPEASQSMEDWCIESCPDLPGYHMMENNGMEVGAGSVLVLQIAGRDSKSFFIEEKLGDGHEGKSCVFEATPIDDVSEMVDDDVEESTPENVVAIKCADSIHLLWEFYIYNTLHSRMSPSQTSACIPKALSFYHGDPQSFLITDRVSVATLDQVLLLESPSKPRISESVVMYFVVELLKTLEIVHSCGVIHADVTLSNITVRRDSCKSWTGPYNAEGQNGWATQGVALVDFNHAVDALHSAVAGCTAEDITRHTSRFGNTHMDPQYVSLAPNEPWGFNIDCHGAAACARKLLEESGGDRISSAVWANVLGRLNGVGSGAVSEDTSSVMRECRGKLEEELTQRSTRDNGVSLRSELKVIYNAALEGRQASENTRV